MVEPVAVKEEHVPAAVVLVLLARYVRFHVYGDVSPSLRIEELAVGAVDDGIDTIILGFVPHALFLREEDEDVSFIHMQVLPVTEVVEASVTDRFIDAVPPWNDTDYIDIFPLFHVADEGEVPGTVQPQVIKHWFPAGVPDPDSDPVVHVRITVPSHEGLDAFPVPAMVESHRVLEYEAGLGQDVDAFIFVVPVGHSRDNLPVIRQEVVSLLHADGKKFPGVEDEGFRGDFIGFTPQSGYRLEIGCLFFYVVIFLHSCFPYQTVLSPISRRVVPVWKD